MLHIPKSAWVLKKKYFQALLNPNFKKEYIEWATNEGSPIDEALIAFLDKVTYPRFVLLYQFPARKGETPDYFEKEDDNYVIPPHLFTLIGE